MFFRNKRRLLARIEGIQPQTNFNVNRYLQHLEHNLLGEYARVLHQEELLWFQKSRAQWL